MVRILQEVSNWPNSETESYDWYCRIDVDVNWELLEMHDGMFSF